METTIWCLVDGKPIRFCDAIEGKDDVILEIKNGSNLLRLPVKEILSQAYTAFRK